MEGAAHSVRAVRATATTVLAALLLAAWAATAHAEPLSMTFTEARANVGVQLADEALFEAPDTALFDAQIDPGSGFIADGQLDVPDFETFVTDPVDANVTVEFHIGVISGSFNEETGALMGTGTAGGTLTADGKTCTVSIPGTLTLSTIGSSGSGKSGTVTPRLGSPFTHGLTGAGAVAGQWSDMTATPETPDDETVCETVDERIGGPGGIWLKADGDVVPPAAPQLTSTSPSSPSASGTPRILGNAEVGSTVKVYAGEGCAGTLVATASAAELSAPGIAINAPEGVTAFFSATATDPAGNASPCSTRIAYSRLKTPPAGPSGPGGGNTGPPLSPPKPKPTCTVPKLAGKTLAKAKKAIKAAGCKLGTVKKPKQPKGKKRPTLVVKSSSPRRGANPADGTVDVKLGPKPKPKKARRR